MQRVQQCCDNNEKRSARLCVLRTVFFEALGFYKSSIQPVLFEFTVFSITEFLSMRAI